MPQQPLREAQAPASWRSVGPAPLRAALRPAGLRSLPRPHRSLTRGPHSAGPAPMGAPTGTPGTLPGGVSSLGTAPIPPAEAATAESPVQPRPARPAAAKVRPRLRQQRAPRRSTTIADHRSSLSRDTECIIERKHCLFFPQIQHAKRVTPILFNTAKFT